MDFYMGELWPYFRSLKPNEHQELFAVLEYVLARYKKTGTVPRMAFITES